MDINGSELAWSRSTRVYLDSGLWQAVLCNYCIHLSSHPRNTEDSCTFTSWPVVALSAFRFASLSSEDIISLLLYLSGYPWIWASLPMLEFFPPVNRCSYSSFIFLVGFLGFFLIINAKCFINYTGISPISFYKVQLCFPTICMLIFDNGTLHYAEIPDSDVITLFDYCLRTWAFEIKSFCIPQSQIPLLYHLLIDVQGFVEFFNSSV